MNKIYIDSKETIITSSKDIYIYDDKDTERIYNIEKDVTLNVYHYNVDSNTKVVINLNVVGAKVYYHYSTINYNDNNFKIVINHNKENTTSNIYNHGVNILNNNLHFDVTGIVPKKIENCICNQENQIINLESGNSTILPILLIDNYNVSSAHSAYIGKFREDVIFYLMSRGIKRDQATKLLIKSLLINNGSETEELIKFKDKIENI